MSQVIFILIDGLNAQSSKHMAFMEACANEVKYSPIVGSMNCVLPPVSRPVYATIFTGYSPLETGITSNAFKKLPKTIFENNFFNKMHNKKLTCAAVAFHWMREIYFGEMYTAEKHRLNLNENHGINNGIYYMDDNYADAYVLQDAECLRTLYKPDFLLIHTMGVDHAGHLQGGESQAYRQAVRNIDMLLAKYLPVWINENYTIIITSDHGMHADGAHNDTLSEVISVPYWILQAKSPSMKKPPTKQEDWYTYLCHHFNLLINRI